MLRKAGGVLNSIASLIWADAFVTPPVFALLPFVTAHIIEE